MNGSPESVPGPVLAVVPARWGSSRFPGKVLAPLAGRPVLAWVLDSVSRRSGSTRCWWRPTSHGWRRPQRARGGGCPDFVGPRQRDRSHRRGRSRSPRGRRRERAGRRAPGPPRGRRHPGRHAARRSGGRRGDPGLPSRRRTNGRSELGQGRRHRRRTRPVLLAGRRAGRASHRRTGEFRRCGTWASTPTVGPRSTGSWPSHPRVSKSRRVSSSSACSRRGPASPWAPFRRTPAASIRPRIWPAASGSWRQRGGAL